MVVLFGLGPMLRWNQMVAITGRQNGLVINSHRVMFLVRYGVTELRHLDDANDNTRERRSLLGGRMCDPSGPVVM